MKRLHHLIIVLLLASLLAGCQTIPKRALQLSHESLAQRQMQTRRFDTANEGSILSASAAVLQDMGFNLEESETKLGLIVGSKNRSAVDGAQVAAAILIAALGGGGTPIDDHQIMRASLVSRPFGENQIAVRVTFQRVVFNTRGRISRQEPIIDAETYQTFFSKLSKSVFLEAHHI